MKSVAFISCSKSTQPQAEMKMAKNCGYFLISDRTVLFLLSHVDNVQLCARESERGMLANCDVVALLGAGCKCSYHCINHVCMNLV